MKQRLCLARALVHDPKVLLLDEPASGLDPRARSEMRELVQALREMGKTIVLSSHILPELAEMCSSYGIIHDGRMVAHGPAGAILGNLGPRRARARVQGDLEEAERLAGGIAGVSNVRRAGPDTLEIELAGHGPTDERDGRRHPARRPGGGRHPRRRLPGGRRRARAAVPAVDRPGRANGPQSQWSRPDDRGPWSRR